MARQSISFSESNDRYLTAQVQSGEYSSKSEVVNDLIRQARRQQESDMEAIRSALVKAEESVEKYGYSSKTMDGIMQEVMERKRRNGTL